MRRFCLTLLPAAAIALSIVLGLAALAVPADSARADHAIPGFGVTIAPTATTVQSGGEGATWEVITSLIDGNPHTDLDFFNVDGDYYVAAGTLAIGLNAGGQIIYRLTVNGEVEPSFVSAFGSANCLSDPTQATALQHDVEITPKGPVLFNTDWKGSANEGRPQLLLDATDGPGRCHDQTTAGGSGTPPGGLEIVDITDLAHPVEIGLTSHIGETHTVNVNPKRPHIAYSSTSDSVTVANRPEADNPDLSEQNDLDGFELVDLSSCMNFPAGTSVAAKRAACRPQVYRYRFPSDWARGTYGSASAGGCHELEVYPDDKLTCAALKSTIVLDMSDAFDDKGTPDDYTDDVPRGTPLPCSVRASVSEAPFATEAMVTDCVNGTDGQALTVGGWLKIGAPSLEGVKLVGFINHAAGDRPPSQDIAISHEAEFTSSGKFLIVSDERGGGLTPPDASCPEPGSIDDATFGNGGLHAYAVDRLFTEFPGDPLSDAAEDIAQRADAAYALAPDGTKAIYRALPRVAAPSFCTAHVFQQIPGQNRIFMGWYTQGTQVVDYIENEDGTFEWREAAWWVPEGGTQWASHVFKHKDNGDGTFTYWGVSADITRVALDVYSVTMPAPPQMKDAPAASAKTPSASRFGGAAGLALLFVLVMAGVARRRAR